MSNLFEFMAARPQLLGMESLLSPFLDKTSSQRGSMLASHCTQALVVAGGEHPRIGSGFEGLIGTYEIDRTQREQDIQIIAVIPKYVPGQGAFPIRENPSTTVIYLGHTDNKVNYFNLEKYTKCADGFGYKNKLMNESFLTEGSYIPQDMKFTTSPSHDGEKYGMGLNVKTAYMSLDGVTEDAFIISDTLAQRMASTAVKKLTFKVSPDQIPLNLYGDDNEYRFMPDIGEKVREDGIICCFRKPSVSTFVSDVMNDALITPQPLHDIPYMVPYSGATVIDIDIDINRNCKNRISKDIYNQVYKYKESNNMYHERVLQAYKEALERDWRISPAFNTLVYRSMVHLMAEGRTIKGIPVRKGNIVLINKKDPIEFLNVTVTYQYDNVVAPGFKITSRDGAKGVVCLISKEEDMPVDEYGFRADLIVDGGSVPNRMNPGQLYEQFITRTDEFVRRRMSDLANGIIASGIDYGLDRFKGITPTKEGAWAYFIQYLTDVNPPYAELVAKAHPTTENKLNMLVEIERDGIYQVIPPFTSHINTEWVLKMDKLYPAPATPVTFTVFNPDGSKKKVTTVDPIMIGDTYRYLLCKIPKVKAAGVGYVNHYYAPSMPTALAKLLYPISQTCLRLGEDEVRNLVMVLGSSAQVARLLGIYANSHIAMNSMITHLLNAPKPSALKKLDISTSEVINSNNMAAMAKHLMGTVGVCYTTRTTLDEAVYSDMAFTETTDEV